MAILNNQLKKTKFGAKNNLPMILIILDGWGIDKPNRGNAVTLAKTPVLEELKQKYPSTELFAHGKYAGLPELQVGNSEAGHMNIGAGRLVLQDSVKITESINDGTFFKNAAFMEAIRHVQRNKSNLHIMGMLANNMSPHADPGHLLALLNLAKQQKIDKIYLHLFTDGRDSPKYASLKLIDELDDHFFNGEVVATVMGRFYAMDRKKKWERTEMAYDALVMGKGRRAPGPKQAITNSYNRGESDEFIEPYVMYLGEKPITRISDNDSIIFFNLRSDRARQLAKAFVQEDFTKMNPGSFVRKKVLKNLRFISMTDFGPDLGNILTAYPSIDLDQTLPMQLGDLSQLYIAENEKYAHVTYFFNGGYSGIVAGEKQFMIPSPDVKSYDETPIMCSDKLTDEVLKNIESQRFDFTVLNFAAPDMVGHTGNLDAGIVCCTEIDKLLGKIVKKYLDKNGTVIITADHGNIEEMINLETDEIDTEHSTNKVPFIIVNKSLANKVALRHGGILGDIAPTILDLMGREKPEEMTGKTLIISK